MASRYMFANFNTVEEASGAYAELLDNGYRSEDISIVATEASRRQFDMQTDTSQDERGDIGVAEGAATGAVTGGLIGLLVSAVPLAIAGLPSLIIVGPIAAALGLTGVAGTATSGAIAGSIVGGIVGAFDKIGIESDAAKAFQTTIQDGGVLVIIPVSLDTEEEARSIFDRSGAGTIQIGQLTE